LISKSAVLLAVVLAAVVAVAVIWAARPVVALLALVLILSVASPVPLVGLMLTKALAGAVGTLLIVHAHPVGALRLTWCIWVSAALVLRLLLESVTMQSFELLTMVFDSPAVMLFVATGSGAPPGVAIALA
jgi:hypothetical protein